MTFTKAYLLARDGASRQMSKRTNDRERKITPGRMKAHALSVISLQERICIMVPERTNERARASFALLCPGYPSPRHTRYITTGFCAFNPPRAPLDDSIWILYILSFEYGGEKMHVTHTHLHTCEREGIIWIRFVFSRVCACSPLATRAKSLGVIENRHFEGYV